MHHQQKSPTQCVKKDISVTNTKVDESRPRRLSFGITTKVVAISGIAFLTMVSLLSNVEFHYEATRRGSALMPTLEAIHLPSSSSSSLNYNSKSNEGLHTETIKASAADDIDNLQACLRPSGPRYPVSESKALSPFINLGMPKMGSTSLHKYFRCGGFKSSHYMCGNKMCAVCMKNAIKAGKHPLSFCNNGNNTKFIDAYTQIDMGPEKLIQVKYLSEIISGIPEEATFILPIRNITNWYKSLTNWYGGKAAGKSKDDNMRKRFERANIKGLPPGVGRNVTEFSNFYCEYVKRVREEVSKNPRHTLIEIDVEDPTAGEQLEAYLGVNRTCWGQGNANKRNNDAIPLHELGR